MFPHINNIHQSLGADCEVPPRARRLTREGVRRRGILGLRQGPRYLQLPGDGARRAGRVLGVGEEAVGSVEGAEEAGDGGTLRQVHQRRLGHGDGGGGERLNEVGDTGEDIRFAGVGQGGAEGGEWVDQDGGVDGVAGGGEAVGEGSVA